MPELDESKLKKLQEIKESGINPFPYNYHQTNHATEINDK